MTTPPPLPFRSPSTSTTPPSPDSPQIPPPTLSWLAGPWNVTHSTLPMWRKSRNVRITYTPLPISSTPAGPGSTHLDDEVSYQPLDKTKSKISTVRGVDRPFATSAASENQGQVEGEGDEKASLGYNWRGKGWLMIASSKWEILGYGEEAGDDGNSWVVTYFAKTLFTPAGVDFYSRKGQLKSETVQGIKSGLAGLGGDVAKLAGEVFEVAWDGEREPKV